MSRLLNSPSSLPSESENVMEEFYVSAVEISSNAFTSMNKWSVLSVDVPTENEKLRLAAEGLYNPGSGEICTKYIPMSDSDVYRHTCYGYPTLTDPGIEKALLGPEIPVMYGSDGQELYKQICEKMETCIVGIFYRGLLTDDINLSYYGVNPNAIRSMAEALKINKTVRHFNLTDNFLNADACYHLGQMLIINNTLRNLNLSGCRIGLTGIIKLVSTLAVNRGMEEINLSRNCLGEEGGVELAKRIDAGSIVPRMNLSKNNLGRLTAVALSEALEYRNIITHLDLSRNNFYQARSTVKLLERLANSDVLEQLNLSWNSMEGESIAEAIGKLLDIPTLSMLVLNNNRLRGNAVNVIISNLAKAKKLVTFDLSYNPLSTADVYTVLRKMLLRRVKLQKLLLNGIPVSKEFVTLLERIKRLKFRLNFSIEYGQVICNWVIQGPDARAVILERANYLGWVQKTRKLDIGLYLLALYKEFPKFIPVNIFKERLVRDRVPLDEDLINELAVVFPGPKTTKSKTINIDAICDYIHRIWPDKKLPSTPLPEPEIEEQPSPYKIEKPVEEVYKNFF